MGNLANLNINDIKMILKFEFINDNKVKLHLVSIKESCLYNDKKQQGWSYYIDDSNKFTIWSTGEFKFNRTELRLPDKRHYKGNISCVCKFSDDKTRRVILKKLYDTLTKWSNNMDNLKLKNRVIVDDEFWYIK